VPLSAGSTLKNGSEATAAAGLFGLLALDLELLHRASSSMALDQLLHLQLDWIIN